MCVGLCVCQWTKCKLKGCTDLDAVFATGNAQKLIYDFNDYMEKNSNQSHYLSRYEFDDEYIKLEDLADLNIPCQAESCETY